MTVQWNTKLYYLIYQNISLLKSQAYNDKKKVFLISYTMVFLENRGGCRNVAGGFSHRGSLLQSGAETLE